MPNAKQEAVCRRALEYLRPAATAGDPDWLTLPEAAARLRTTERALKRAFSNRGGAPRIRLAAVACESVVDIPAGRRSSLAPGYFAACQG